MSDKSWFQSQKDKGLIDFKCAVISKDSSLSVANHDLTQAQAIIDAEVGEKPNSSLRPDRADVLAVRKKMSS